MRAGGALLAIVEENSGGVRISNFDLGVIRTWTSRSTSRAKFGKFVEKFVEAHASTSRCPYRSTTRL
jgi:hypothetical protein